MVCNAFRSEILSMPLNKWERESDDLFPSEFYERTWASEYPTKILSEDLLPTRSIERQEIKILPAKQMLQRLPIMFARAGKTSEKLLNEIRKIVYSLYRAKQISEHIYNNLFNSFKGWVQYSWIHCNIVNNQYQNGLVYICSK